MPLQKPHPPLWYGVHANDSAARSAKQGAERHQPRSASRRRAASAMPIAPRWNETGRAGPMPKFGLGRMLVVADTDAEALRLAERAYPVWHASFVHLFKVYDRDADASAAGRQFSGDAGRRPRHLRLARAPVTEIIRQQMAEAGADYFVGAVRLRRSDARGDAGARSSCSPREVDAGPARR